MLDTLLALDAQLRGWIVAHHTLLLDQAMQALSDAGGGGVPWLVIGAALVWRRPSRAAVIWQAALAILLAALIADAILKPIVGRARPFMVARDVAVIDTRPSSSSFPSGHAATSFAGAAVLALAWPAGRAALWALALLVAFSRVYVGVHYPLDIAAGALVGLFAAYVALGGKDGMRIRRAHL